MFFVLAAITDHFTVVGLVSLPLNECEVEVDLVLTQTCFLVEMYATEEQHDLHVHNKAATVVSKQRQLQDHFHNCKMGLGRHT